MAAPAPRGPFKDTSIIYLGLLLGLGVIAIVMWYVKHAEISYYGMKWAWNQLGWLDWFFMPEFIQQWRLEAAQLATQPHKITFEQLLGVLNKAGYFFIALPICLTTSAILAAHRHRAMKTRRVITVETLPWLMAQHQPAGIPVLYYGDLLNSDPPEQRWSQHPEEWVAEHGVLINHELDKAKCRQLFIAQLGKRLTSIHDLDGAARALFAVFAQQVCSRGSERDKAIDLLDALNRSCHTHTFQGKPGYPDLSLCDKAFKKYADHADMRALVLQHSYERTFMSALHKRACYSGNLAVVTSASLASVGSGDFASVNFRWLKGMDRALWYTLNCTGRQGPFIENAGVYAQTLWEQYVADVGYVLPKPYVEDAIDGLQGYLVKIKLISKEEPHAKPS
jgi:intracellular multiplication protein IcmP